MICFSLFFLSTSTLYKFNKYRYIAHHIPACCVILISILFENHLDWIRGKNILKSIYLTENIEGFLSILNYINNTHPVISLEHYRYLPATLSPCNCVFNLLQSLFCDIFHIGI